MANITDWKYSEEVEAAAIPVEAGLRYLMVTDVQYDETEETYEVYFQDLQNDARFRCKYWLNNTDSNNNIKPNSAARGTLISLGHSILGTDKGIPYPDDIIGGVTCGDVVLKEFNGKTYPKIFRYTPVNSDWVVLGTLEDQYFED